MSLMTKKKPGPPKSAIPSKNVGLKIPQPLFDALDRHVRKKRPAPTHQEVIRVALEDYLAAQGDYELPDEEHNDD